MSPSMAKGTLEMWYPDGPNLTTSVLKRTVVRELQGERIGRSGSQ